MIGIRSQVQLKLMSTVLGATFGIGIKKQLLKVNRKKKKQRMYLSSGDTIKRISPLPVNVDDSKIKIKVRRQKGHGLDLVYDRKTEEIKLFVRYTFLQVNNEETLMDLTHLMNYEVPENDNVSVASISNNDIIGKIFFDCEKNKLLKVVSVVNSNSIKVIECD